MKDKMRECPFCGGKPYSKSLFNLNFIKCSVCGTTVSFDNDECNREPRKALEYFNKRANDKDRKKCGTCAYAVPSKAFKKAQCYVECTNQEHLRKYCSRSGISKVRQRTNPVCRSYVERNESGENRSD